MTELLYMDDSYLREFNAKVVEVLGDNVILNRTAFHPRGGGLPEDTGVFVKEGREVKVVQVFSEEGGSCILCLATGSTWAMLSKVF